MVGQSGGLASSPRIVVVLAVPSTRGGATEETLEIVVDNGTYQPARLRVAADTPSPAFPAAR